MMQTLEYFLRQLPQFVKKLQPVHALVTLFNDDCELGQKNRLRLSPTSSSVICPDCRCTTKE